MMKPWVILVSLVLPVVLTAEDASREEQAFPNLPVKEVVGKMKQKVIQSEQAKMTEIMGKEKAGQYMKYFSDGYDSNTGMILVEGGENSWLEKAFHHGYEAKQVVTEALIEGYMQSLKK
jgi:hypothetical protein